jgi:lipoate-protein ligase A
LTEDVVEAACSAADVPIVRRSSGGGTVLLGAGCLLYSLVLAYDRAPALREILSSYGYILERVRVALTGVGTGIQHAGTSDLAAGERKFSGNAQQRKRRHLLHHGTLLYGFDVDLVGRYLRLPRRQPDYRGGRAHAAFLTNLAAGRAELARRLQTAWGADQPPEAWPAALVRRLIEEKYAQAEWLRRR